MLKYERKYTFNIYITLLVFSLLIKNYSIENRRLTFSVKILRASRPGIITRSNRAATSRKVGPVVSDVTPRRDVKYILIKTSKKSSCFVRAFSNFPKELFGQV